MTTVVAVNVNKIRPKYNNLREWLQDDNNVYIGRNGRIFITEDGEKNIFHYPKSKWHNPYKPSKTLTLDEVLDLYSQYLDEMLMDEANMKEFLQLKGKVLGCWCKPNKCHGDIIISKLNSLINV
jgi:hypothetical protein